MQIFEGMIRSLAFTTQGRLHTKDIEMFFMPTLLADTNLFLWVDLENPTPEESQTVLEEIFHFHPLSIEDCVEVSASPKVEEYTPKEDDRFAPVSVHGDSCGGLQPQRWRVRDERTEFFSGEELSRDLSRTAIEERAVDRRALFTRRRHIARAPDRVAHTLLDGIVENYKPALDELSLEIAQLEHEVIQNPTKEILNRLLQVKKEVLHLRHIIGPQREVLARFAHGEFKLIRPHLVPYYRDVYDGLFHISELAQRYTDSLTGILQVYLNMSSNQTGEVIKVLTLFTVITTPMMIVGTWYGMNFQGMHEFQWKHGYLMAIAITLAATGVTIWWFKKKGWF